MLNAAQSENPSVVNPEVMKKTLLLSVTLLSCLFTQKSSADLIAGWDFAGLLASPNTPATIAATVGTGSIDASAFLPAGANPERTAFGGSTLNAFAGGDAAAGMALSLVSSNANNKSLIFSFSMLGYEDLVVSFATRGTSTGFNTHAWSWSTDGVTYTPVVGNTAVTATSFEVKTLDLSAVVGLDNATSGYLMLTVSGATSTSGNNRLDNIQFNAAPLPVPEPSAAAIFGGFGVLALVMASRRRD